MKQQARQSGGAIESFFRGTDLSHLSAALVIASAEFVACAGMLLALAVRGAISPDTATLWGAVILIPLSLTIGILGVGVGLAGKRAVIRGADHDPADPGGRLQVVHS